MGIDTERNELQIFNDEGEFKINDDDEYSAQNQQKLQEKTQLQHD